MPRLTGRGGGIACIYRSIFSLTSVSLPTFSSFEAMAVKFTCASKSYLILSVYRPPSSSKTDFVSDFSQLLEGIASSPSNLVILGDFNVHADNINDNLTSSFLNILETFDLKQHVSVPTHSSGHTLDLFITRNAQDVLQLGICEPFLSDHSAVFGKLPVIKRPRPLRMIKTMRRISAINTVDFSNDILSSSLYTNPEGTLSSFTMQFISVLSSLLDKHAPERTYSCRSSDSKPFITPEIIKEKAKRSHLESVYRKNKTVENHSKFKLQSKLVTKLIKAAKRLYYRATISLNKDNPKQLWKVLDSLLGRDIPPSLPNSDSPSSLATSFLNFFNDKIEKLSSSIPVFATHDPNYCAPSVKPPSIDSFTLANVDEIRKLILSSTNSTCSLDIIPTRLLKSCVDALVQPITHLVNLSLREGSFPDTFKSAVVRPLIKKHSLPKDDLSSYRPISNLNFVSKILEKVIYSRLCDHLESFQSFSAFQSAYRKYYSTETALLRIHNDLLLAMNRQQVSALVLLDLSAAFDTIDHGILINRLSSCFGISKTALTLLSSYLTGRSQCVSIAQEQSEPLPLLRGVPQGSVLGPLLFTLYTTPLSYLLSDSSIKFHFYADDTQLYVAFSSSDSSVALAKLSSVLDEVYAWFCSNRLSVNPSKTEYLLIGTPQQRSKITSTSVVFKNLSLSPSASARNLGVNFDSCLDFKGHISSICRSSSFQIRQLRQIRSSLDRNSAIVLANSLVHARIDYCNSLLFGLPETSIIRLQRMQNSLARVVCQSNKLHSHTKSLLKQLHWLPISERIKFKIAVLTFKVLQSGKPSYLSDLIVPYQPERYLRSSTANLLVVPNIRSSMGRRSFSYSAPTVWNSLPLSLRVCTSLNSFCSMLKTHLFPP